MMVCFTVDKNCWNLLDSYGEICVRCGCCSKDKKIRYSARIERIERWIEEEEHFDGWADDKDLRALQEKNIKSNIKCYRRQLRYYKKRLREAE